MNIIKIRFLDGHVRQFSRMILETRQPHKQYEYPAEIGITSGPDKPSVMFIGRLYKNIQEVKQVAELVRASTPNVQIVLNDVSFMEVVYPQPVSYTYKIRLAKDFGVAFPTSYHEIELAVAEPYHGCTALTNALHIHDSVALIQRGECSFVTKTLNAQQAGAVAVIITDSDLNNDQQFIDMIQDNTGRSVDIPAAFLLGKDGYMIKQTLESLNLGFALVNIPINVTGVAIHQVNQPPWTLW